MVEVKKEGLMKRFSTNYLGVYYRVVKRFGHPNKTEKMYYASYYKGGKKIETPVGRQYKDGMTPARASLIRGELLEGKRLTNKEKREKAAAEAETDRGRWTIGRIFETYQERRPEAQ
jgi:hypothetical protein